MTATADRRSFLAPLRARLAGGIPANPAHPPPAPLTAVPGIDYVAVHGSDLLGSFAEQARRAGATVHLVTGAEPPADLLTALVARHAITSAVVSAEPEAQAAAPVLRGAGVDVAAGPVPVDRAAGADLGVTSAVAVVAATGSVVLDSGATGSRSVSLLPRVHLCVVPAAFVVRSPSEVLRPLSGAAGPLPSNLVFVTGPSRTGDIEQLLTIGVHGPTAVEVVVTGCPAGGDPDTAWPTAPAPPAEGVAGKS